MLLKRKIRSAFNDLPRPVSKEVPANDVTTKMAASIRFRVARVCAYILARFPFVNAITLVLLLAERAKRET